MSAQPAKPNPLLGLVVGAVAAWLGTIAVAYASEKLTFNRMFENSVSDTLP